MGINADIMSLAGQETELAGLPGMAIGRTEFQPTLSCLSHAWALQLLESCLLWISRLNLASRFPRYGFKGMLMLKMAECQGFGKGAERELWLEGIGGGEMGSSPDFTKWTIPSDSLSLIFLICDRRNHNTSLTAIIYSCTRSTAFTEDRL